MNKINISLLIFISIFIVIIVIYNYYFDRKIEIQLDQCIDGDTAWFIINGKKEKVRLLGIDTPESIHPNGIIEEYGIEASNYTCDVLKSANYIYLEYDSNSDPYDKYNRVLGWVFVDNNNLSELLLSKGYAEVQYIYGDYKYIDRLCSIQEEAYYNRLGIWNTSKYDTYQKNYCYK